MFTFALSIISITPILGFSNILKSTVGALIAALSTFAGVSLLVRPKELISVTINQINHHKYFEETHIESGDFFQEMFNLLKDYKNVIKSDFVEFKDVSYEANKSNQLV
ncbi:hypothetical protein ACER0A_013510 [Haloimpatiens sp. FM7315]|uniref:hypothetical protein n=1 Tax=Haloimpatiens sp. FM7315 TaxID=3298609 RepID=UPI0035A3CBC0